MSKAREDQNLKATSVHSEQFFGDTRDYWWNRDFLELMARRWNLSQVRKTLDVGCGRGHWTQELASFLTESSVIGIDPESESLEHARARAQAKGLNPMFQYQLGSAETLPFSDESFDFVTCQTVLIHLADPQKALREMLRVLRPGGLLAVAEPNNQANAMYRDSVNLSVEIQIELVRFQMRCERGKMKLGLGFNSVGDLVPGYFSELGLKEIQVYHSDKASSLFPPYETPEQKASRAEVIEWTEKEIYLWGKEETRKYFLADSGTAAEFEEGWKRAGEVSQAIKQQLLDGTYHSARGAMMYLVSGRK